MVPQLLVQGTHHPCRKKTALADTVSTDRALDDLPFRPREGAVLTDS